LAIPALQLITFVMTNIDEVRARLTAAAERSRDEVAGPVAAAREKLVSSRAGFLASKAALEEALGQVQTAADEHAEAAAAFQSASAASGGVRADIADAVSTSARADIVNTPAYALDVQVGGLADGATGDLYSKSFSGSTFTQGVLASIQSAIGTLDTMAAAASRRIDGVESVSGLQGALESGVEEFNAGS